MLLEKLIQKAHSWLASLGALPLISVDLNWDSSSQSGCIQLLRISCAATMAKAYFSYSVVFLTMLWLVEIGCGWIHSPKENIHKNFWPEMFGRCKGCVPGSLKQAYYNLDFLVILMYVFLLILGSSRKLSVAQGFMSIHRYFVCMGSRQMFLSERW